MHFRWMDGFGRVPRQIESRRGVTGADADNARSDHRRRREERAGEASEGGEGKAPQDNNISDIGRKEGCGIPQEGQRGSERARR